MNQIMSLNRHQAREDSESEFSSPQEVRDEIGLTLGEKLAALSQWGSNVERRLAAAGEGMQATDSHANRDAELLRQINVAIQDLKNSSA